MNSSSKATKGLKFSFLTLLGTTCLFDNPVDAAEIRHESHKGTKVHHHTTIPNNTTQTGISKLVQSLINVHEKELRGKWGNADNAVDSGFALSSMMFFRNAIKELDNLETWATHSLDSNMDESISDILTLGELKKQALDLQDEAVETLLKCYLYSKFGFQMMNENHQMEFRTLLDMFSKSYPVLCGSLADKALLKNSFGLPLKEGEVLETYTLIQKNSSEEGIRDRLREIPYCYLTSFEFSLGKNKVRGESFFKPYKNENTPLEIKLKKAVPDKIIKVWHDILYNQKELLTSDYDYQTDPAVMNGEISLGNLKKSVLNGNMDDFITLIEAYKEHRFKLPNEDYVAQEATEWLALFSVAFPEKYADLYVQALTNNWFGTLSRYNPGYYEASILNTAARKSNLAARGLLQLPPFSDVSKYEMKINEGEEEKRSSKQDPNGCIVS